MKPLRGIAVLLIMLVAFVATPITLRQAAQTPSPLDDAYFTSISLNHEAVDLANQYAKEHDLP